MLPCKFRRVVAVEGARAMPADLFQTTVEKALLARDFPGIRAACADQLSPDVADFIESLEEEQRAVLFRLLPREQAAETFEYLQPETQEGLIKAMAREQVASSLNDSRLASSAVLSPVQVLRQCCSGTALRSTRNWASSLRSALPILVGEV